MSYIILVITAVCIAFLAWYWWQARVRQPNIDKLKQATAVLNKDFEGSGYRINITEGADGSVQAVSNMTSEQIEDKLGNALPDGIGEKLFTDQSPETIELLAFLANVYEANADKTMTTPRDVGIAWFACLQLTQKEPDSELAQTFKCLNDAWTATRQQQEQT